MPDLTFTAEENQAVQLARWWMRHLYLNRKVAVEMVDQKMIDKALPHLASALEKIEKITAVLS